MKNLLLLLVAFAYFRFSTQEISEIEKFAPNVAYIDVKSDDPMVLFKEWKEEACKRGVACNLVILATSSDEYPVLARVVNLWRLDDDGFVITTPSNSRKAKQLMENPTAAMTFLWTYPNGTDQFVIQQVRVDGTMKKLDIGREEIFNSLPVYHKIMKYTSKAYKPVKWEDTQNSYTELLKELRAGKNLTMPEDFSEVAFKLYPEKMEFYLQQSMYSLPHNVLFERTLGSKSLWSYVRRAA